jgi:hypothetical protein
MANIQLQFRRGTASQWTTNGTVVLASGEMGIETDTKKFKIGDGTTQWTSLAYGGIQGTTGYTGSAGVVGIAAYTTTATAGTTTTLTSSSTYQQFFTGSTTQTVILPVTSTLVLGQQYLIVNNSTGNVTVQSSGANNILVIPGSTAATFTVILTSGTSTASWSADYTGFSNVTGTGNNVLATAPTFNTSLSLAAQGAIQFYSTNNSNYVGFQAPTTLAANKTWVLPSVDGTANQVLQTNGSGTLTFATLSGGEAWQTVQTANFNATVKYGYFINTTSAAVTATLPASPTAGDFITFIDYAGTFQTNNFTVSRNGNPIQGSATDLTVATQRAGFTLVYVDSTQGWLLKYN